MINIGRVLRSAKEAFSPSTMGFTRSPAIPKRIGSVADPAKRSYKTLAALGVGAAAIGGMAKGIGSSAREAMMETGFGDPNADAAFLGRNVSARFLIGSAMGGPIGGAVQMTSPQDKFMVDPIAPGLGSTVAGGVIGGTLGGVIGSMKGIKGTIAGAGLGILAGGAAAPAAYTASHVRRNQNFYRRSPYNMSTQNAELLNASGDIVLGMHNLRGGM